MLKIKMLQNRLESLSILAAILIVFIAMIGFSTLVLLANTNQSADIAWSMWIVFSMFALLALTGVVWDNTNNRLKRLVKDRRVELDNDLWERTD